MFTVTNSVDMVHEFELPAGTSGQVFVRVLDTDRDRNEGTPDTIFVDQMYFLSSNGPSNSIPLAMDDGYSIDEDVAFKRFGTRGFKQ